MSRRRNVEWPRFGAMGAAGLALALAGCISVLPKTAPVQLYGFGGPPALPGAVASPPSAAAKTPVAARVVGFEPAAATDRILTVNGDTAAQVAGARWVSPAQILFQTALDEALDASGGAFVRVGRGESFTPAWRLGLDVQQFEARYTGAGAPQVQIVVRATLERVANLADHRERTFSVTVPVETNRVGAIVRGFDVATRRVLADILAWAQPS